MSMQIVQAYRPFTIQGHSIQPGDRLMAWRRDDKHWMVCFNGNEVTVDSGTVGPAGEAMPEAAAAPAYSSARLEQYQLAPAEEKPT